MTPQEAIAYIENSGWSATRLGLDRTRELLRRLGDPQKGLKFVHVAGSNGKGSTCAMLDSILRSAGYRVGLYTSPHIQDFRERIQVNGEYISGQDLADATQRVRAAADAMEDHPSQFELMTAVALLHFLRRECQIVVLEVGMGGELDSTNVIDPPEAAVITNLGLEHTEYLGDTIEKIAATKGGIIKPGCSAVCYDGDPKGVSVIREICRERKVPLRVANFGEITPLSESFEGQRFLWKGQEYRLALLGRYQLRNAATVLETVAALTDRGWNIPPSAVRQGLDRAAWPARMEVMGTHPLFLIDGGHNPQCAEALAESLKRLLPGKKPVFLLGVLGDKDYPRMLESVLPLAKEFICLTPLSDRALPARELARCLTARGAKARFAEEVSAGLEQALDAAGEDGTVVAFGSLYLVGAIREEYLKRKTAG